MPPKLQNSKVISPINTPSRLKLVLDVILLLISVGLALVAVIWFLAATCRQTACGDIVLLSIMPIVIVGLLSVLYLLLDIFYLVARSRRHESIAKRHIIALVLAIGVILFIGVRTLLET